MSTELEEALTAAGVGALIQKQIDPMMLEYQRRYSPLVRTVPAQQWGATDYNFNRRTNRAPGGFVTDGGARPVGNSVYEQFKFTIRNMQSVGAVTGYAQTVTASLIGDLRRQEIESCVQGLLWDIETAMLWGNDPATNLGPYPQFSGLANLITQFASVGMSPQNAVDENGVSFTTNQLDRLIDLVESNAAAPVGSNYMFVMSPTANSKVSQGETAFQRFTNQVEVAAGLNVMSYRDIPIIKSSFLSSRGGAMSPVAATPGGTGGALPAGARSYIITAVVSRYGELSPSAEVTATTTTATSTVALAFTPPQGPEGAFPLSYKVYEGAAGAETLLGVVDAVVGLQGDGVTPIFTTSIVDTGAALVPQNGNIIPASTPAAYVGGSAERPRSAGGEDVYLIPKDRDVLLRPYTRDVRPVDIYPTTSSPDSLPFALLTDTCLALRAPKYAGRLRNVTATLAA